MKTGALYKATNTVNGKCYIGQTMQTILQRKGEHLRAAFAEKNIRYNGHFYRAIRKYGKKSFEWEILAVGIPIDCLNAEETEAIRLCDSFVNGYNSHSGGGNGRIVSEETGRKISQANKGNKVNLGRHLSREHRRKISLANLGQSRSEEFKKKCSENTKGTNNPMYGKHPSEKTREKLSKARSGKNNPNFGKHWSDETKKRMSDIQKGRHLSDERKAQISRATKGKNNPMYGKHHSLETLKKISQSKKGNLLSEEHRKKISLGLMKFNEGSEVTAI